MRFFKLIGTTLLLLAVLAQSAVADDAGRTLCRSQYSNQLKQCPSPNNSSSECAIKASTKWRECTNHLDTSSVNNGKVESNL